VAELILYAIPAFVLLLIVELLSFKYARDEWTYVLLYGSPDGSSGGTRG